MDFGGVLLIIEKICKGDLESLGGVVSCISIRLMSELCHRPRLGAGREVDAVPRLPRRGALQRLDHEVGFDTAVRSVDARGGVRPEQLERVELGGRCRQRQQLRVPLSERHRLKGT